MKLKKGKFLQMVKKVVFGVLIFVSISTLVYLSFDLIRPDIFHDYKSRYETIENTSLAWQIYGMQDTSNISERMKIWTQFPPPVAERCLLASRNFSSKDFREDDVEFLNSAKGLKYKTILFYYTSSPGLYYGFGRRSFEASCCKERRCFVTSRRDVIPLTNFDAVLINYRDFNVKKLPEARLRHQRWIFYEAEPPTHVSSNIEPLNGVFNWTMTYRKDSDILVEYGHVYPKRMFVQNNFTNVERSSILSLNALMKSKTKMAAWLVSNCKSNSERELLVQEIQKYFKVDIFGGCGSLRCDRSEGRRCYENLERNYKFYFSFENSLCKDYITEKFFRALNFYIIPVVYGSGDYDSVAPPHSYIDVRDFRSERDLAAYLIYLNGNDTAYMEYFKWKEDYIVLDDMLWLTQAISFCRLCEKLHEDGEPKTMDALGGWFFEMSKCKGRKH